jgi:hypothetical protein
MQPSPNTVSYPSLPDSLAENLTAPQSEDRVYQAFTIAAILLVLGSIWIF